MNRADVLIIFGIGSLFGGLVAPFFNIEGNNFFIYAIIFLTGSFIIREIQDKK